MRVLRYLIIALLLLFVLFLVPSEVIAEIIEIPLDQEKMDDINEKFYLSDMEYQDESLHVVIEEGRAYETDYLFARITIANATQIRSGMVSPNGKGEMNGNKLAKRINAVFAINGDFYQTNKTGLGKHVVRQGVLKKHNATGDFDALIIDDKGDFHIIPKAKEADFASFEGTIVNCYAFGPAIVIDGEPVYGITDKGVGAEKPTQRVCVAQTGELSYLVVCCAGPENPGSTGMTLDQFTELVVSFGDVQNAYNMDGGGSATMVFKNTKINSFGSKKIRQISDILYFASAYREEGN